MNKPRDGMKSGSQGQADVFYISRDPEHARLAEEATKCCLCGTELAFERELDFETMTVKESSECPSCRIRTRARVHGLH